MKKTKNVDDPKLKKADGEEEEVEEVEGEGSEEEGEEKMEKKTAKKGEDLSADDLQKSLDKLEDYVEGQDTTTRKQALLEKAQNAELSKAEQDELFKLLGNETEPEKSQLSEEVIKGMDDNEDLQKALDVSDYLQEQHTENKMALGVLADYIEKSDSRQHEFNLVLARAVAETGRLAKSIDDRLAALEGQPARGPKSKGLSAKPLEKSFAGQQANNDQGGTLSKAQILDAMEEMLVKSVNEGRGGATEDGFALDVAASQYEQFNTINPRLLQQVQAHIQSKGTAVH